MLRSVRSVVGGGSAPKICLGEVDDLVGAAAHDGLDHVERESLRYVNGDRGRHGKLGAVYDRIDENRSVVRKSSGDPVRHLGRIFEADAANADRLGHRGKVRIDELGAEVEEAGGFLLELDEAERTVVEDDDLHRELQL